MNQHKFLCTWPSLKITCMFNLHMPYDYTEPSYECWLCTKIVSVNFLPCSQKSSRSVSGTSSIQTICVGQTQGSLYIMDTKGAWSYQTFWINKSTHSNWVRITSLCKIEDESTAHAHWATAQGSSVPIPVFFPDQDSIAWVCDRGTCRKWAGLKVVSLWTEVHTALFS